MVRVLSQRFAKRPCRDSPRRNRQKHSLFPNAIALGEVGLLTGNEKSRTAITFWQGRRLINNTGAYRDN